MTSSRYLIRHLTTRRVLAAGIGVATAAALAACGSSPAASVTPSSARTVSVVEQLGWLGDYEQAGEAVALAKGWYKDAGLNLTIQQGGPNNDGVNVVATGRALVGQTSSSPALMLARSQGEPVVAIAAGLQKHPFSYISLPSDPVRTPAQLKGKVVGTQATAEILLHALEAKNNIPQSAVTVRAIGSDVTPLITHQVQVWTGWLTDQGSLSKLDGNYVSMPLWNTGIHLYALVYYTSDQTLKNDSRQLDEFIAATARGWAYAAAHPDEAVTDVLKLYPNAGLDRAAQLASLQVLVSQFMSSSYTAEHGWGAMDPAIWQQQLTMWNQLGQFHGSVPTVDQVMTTSVLNATASARPKLSPSGS
jgi:NitT/TauT family transport system substrate-binding protein